MPIARKLVGIAASTLPTVPINLTRLGCSLAWAPLSPVPVYLLFGFQKGGDDRVDCLQGCRFGLLLHFLEDALRSCPCSFPAKSVYSYC